MSVLSDRLKELRGTQSQAEMAKPLGIVYQQWAKYERGESAPGSELLAKICRIHACSADWLLGLDRHSSSITVHGSGNAIANGPHAKASVVAQTTSCKTCPYKKWGDKLRKEGLKIPGL